MTVGSRFAFATWRLYRTSSVARRFLEPMVRRSAEKGLAKHEVFQLAAMPSEEWWRPWDASGARSHAHARAASLFRHWNARLPLESLGIPGLRVGKVRFANDGDSTLEKLRAAGHPLLARVFGEAPRPAGDFVPQGSLGALPAGVAADGTVTLHPLVLSPFFLASPWGCVVPDALDLALGRTDWRDPLPPLVSARIDDVTGEQGLGWLRAFEEQGIRPSIGTLHDRWLAGPSVNALVEASRRGCSVSPHAFDMDRFIWFDAHAARPFAHERMEEHRAKIARDVTATGLVLGKTVNGHFDVFGETALEAARKLGFEFLLGEHRVSQDWREPPRARDPLGTPLYCYERAGPLLAFQAEGAIASSAAKRSRYDWLRNFLAVDRRTNLPIKESLDRPGAVAQGVTQLLSALYAGFPAYLLAHEVHLDALGPELLGELLSDVLREVRARVPGIRPAAFDELPAACRSRAL